MVFAGKYFEAEELFGKTMLGHPVEQMKYQPLANLFIEFPGHAKAAEMYSRELDLDTGIANVWYSVHGVQFHRQVFASAVDQAIVFNLIASNLGAITANISLAGVTNTKTPDDGKFSTKVLGPGELVLRGKTGSMLGIEGRVRYEAQARIVNDGGKLLAEKDGAKVINANAVTILVVAATNFKNYKDLSVDPGTGPPIPCTSPRQDL